MGFMRTPKYQRDPELEKQLKEQREEEERIKKEQEAAMEKRKKRFEAGMLGQRSLFARAGGRGFYTEGEET
jgi:hypothetical protein|tara:strand:- start:1 stop:213 length:213 start_codon:yes stop_codon:yes gene_type:complete